MNKLIKHILFISFFIIICGEQIQMYWPLIEAPALKGSFVPPAKPAFTLDNWFSGNYQDSLMKHYEYDLNLHVPFVRLRNQIAYSVFNEINAYAVEEGKQGYLYGNGYINSYLGKDYLGENVIIEKVNKLAYVQAELKKRNVDIILVIPPGKPSLYPQYLPEKYDISKITKSNYDVYAEQLEKQKINYIDYKKYFLKIKSKVKYPLFPKLGVHWSGYGATIAADTLLKRMEKMRNIDLVDYFYLKGTVTNIPRDTDNDIAKIMNTIYPLPSDSLYYPNLVFIKDKRKTKPNVLMIGDSFIWTWVTFEPYFPNMFDKNSQYWYYNTGVGYTNGVYPPNNLVSSLNFKEETLHRDFIILVYNESGLLDCGSYFIEQMYNFLKQENATAEINVTP